MRLLLLAAACLVAATSVSAAIPTGVPIDTDMLAHRRLADAMSYWVNFARSGNPNGPGLPASSTLTFFDSAYQQLLKGGANQ